MKTLKQKMDSTDLYEHFTEPARWVKVLLQMLVGIAAIVIIAVSLVSDVRSGSNAELVARRTLAIIAASLAVAASLELAYTLFTDGPDEVIDPLMMGVSASLLYLVSTLTSLTWTAGIAIAMFAGTLALLFAVRRRFIDKSVDLRELQERLIARQTQIDKIFARPEEAEAALDLLKLAEFAWHDLYRENVPNEIINEILALPWQLAGLVVAVTSVVESHGTLPSPPEFASSEAS
jgi:hypothetical protein